MLRRACADALRLHQRRRVAFSTASAPAPLRYLVIDGYKKWGRDDLESGGATTAGELYKSMLMKATPVEVPVHCDIVFPADPDFEMPDLSQYHGVGWSGSSLTVYKTEEPMIQQLWGLAKAAYAQGVPQFGSCFGAQLAAVTAGGTVRKNPFGKELGIARKIHLTDAGRSHPMYEGKPSVFGGFTSHNDQITHLSAGGLKLAQNAHTSVQAVAVRHLNGEFWGLQYHPEYDLHEFARLLYCRRKVSVELGFFSDIASADAHIADLEALHADRSRTDIAWKLGIDDDVLDEEIRILEVKNFVRHLVLPYRAQLEEL
ncbi:hypothetical protein P43SY_011365 [Pythium insidiosum]|uniref:Glutamine amidotransferase domain-containing protein n=1 Tax=Pythium insidiosum TaxID=114742 RepID=A0AAD5QCY1_PYTIN|nr:hypothetical protein P43SY_011365 [Pythium insidiosum]